MKKFRMGNGVVRTDQGGELARSATYRELMLNTFGYVVESTGADTLPRTVVQKYTTTRWL